MSLRISQQPIESETDAHHVTQLIDSLVASTGVVRRIRILTEILSSVASESVDNDSRNVVAFHLNEVFQAAQDSFRNQLERNDERPPEFLGSRILEFGSVILQSQWIHSSLPETFLNRIRHLPSPERLQQLFEQLKTAPQGSQCLSRSLQSYLLSSIAGEGGEDLGTSLQTAVAIENGFWSRCPRPCQRDLANLMVKIKHLDYKDYVTCIMASLDLHTEVASKLNSILSLEGGLPCIELTSYLARARSEVRELQDRCWLDLLRSLLPTITFELADSIPFDRWIKFTLAFTRSMSPIHASLPLTGKGVTQERQSWWSSLSTSSEMLLPFAYNRRSWRQFFWIYFPTANDPIEELSSLIQSVVKSNQLAYRELFFTMSEHGTNIDSIRQCFQAFDSMSVEGQRIFEEVLLRRQTWSSRSMSALFKAWLVQNSISQTTDRAGLHLLRQHLNIPLPLAKAEGDAILACHNLQSEYFNTIRGAKELGSTIQNLPHRSRQMFLNDLRSSRTSGATFPRADTETEIPQSLSDCVEAVGEDEFELAFPLTELNDLSRKARGIGDARMLLVRIKLGSQPSFCTHLTPDHDQPGAHAYWSTHHSKPPSQAVCLDRSNFFLYCLNRQIYRSWKKRNTLEALYPMVDSYLTSRVTNCVVCSVPLSANTRKPTTCSDCSQSLQSAPLEVSLHNLLYDIKAADLLLSSVYAAANDLSALPLLPGCPIDKARVKTVIDSIPPLHTLVSSTNLKRSILGTTPFGHERLNLLLWLFTSFRGFLISSPPNYRIPSMPSTQQFLMLNSSPEREKISEPHFSSSLRNSSAPVFHGTPASRLFCILMDGLKSMSGTVYQAHGASGGAGVYCGNDMATSNGYAGSIGVSWKHSNLSNMTVMLGCELASYPTGYAGTYHVISDANRLAVRYVFLLPSGFLPPRRDAVEPAMKVAFSSLRSAL